MNDTSRIMCEMIHSKLKERSRNGKIKLKDVNYIMGAIFHIQKEQRITILNEMEKLKLLKLKKKTIIELNEVEIR